MRIGTTLETAIWLDGEETAENLKRFKRDASDSLRGSAADRGFLIGPVMFAEKQIGEDRVPAVPDHIQGPNVRLLTAESVVLSRIPETMGFIHELDRADLVKLRESTRRAYASTHAGARLTDMECDDVINYLGPDVALQSLRG